MKKIDKLSQEQIDKFPEYVNKWVKIGINTEPTNMTKAKKFIKKAYEVAGLTPPKYFIGPVNGPYEAALAEDILKQYAKNGVQFKNEKDLNTKVIDDINEQLKNKPKKVDISNQIYGYQEHWLSYYDYFRRECKLDIDLIDPLIELSKVCGWWTPLKNVAIIQHRAEEIHRDSEGRLHNPNGAAIKFRGTCWANWHSNGVNDVYAVHGVRVPKRVIDGDYTVKDIESETNAEVRRVMIERYGQSKFIVDSGAKEIHKDEFGTLFVKELDNDEPIMMVKVVNSTQETDGTFKDYWIRVDPNAYGGIKTARAAVASTWRNKDGSFVFKSPEEYDCSVET
jgi:hypothetical protein